MARKGGNKKACDRYKTLGRLSENKKKKQEKLQRYLDKMAARRAAKGEREIKYGKKDEHGNNINSNVTPKVIGSCKLNHYAKMRSTMAKLDNWLDKQNEIAKAANDVKRNNKKAED